MNGLHLDFHRLLTLLWKQCACAAPFPAFCLGETGRVSPASCGESRIQPGSGMDGSFLSNQPFVPGISLPGQFRSNFLQRLPIMPV